MPRMTTKYHRALKRLRQLGTTEFHHKPHETVYSELERRGYHWDRTLQSWDTGPAPSTSVFEKTKQGEPTGMIKIRVMAHPDEIEKAVERLLSLDGIQVFEVSKPYTNRRGPGVRIYMDAKLSESVS